MSIEMMLHMPNEQYDLRHQNLSRHFSFILVYVLLYRVSPCLMYRYFVRFYKITAVDERWSRMVGLFVVGGLFLH